MGVNMNWEILVVGAVATVVAILVPVSIAIYNKEGWSAVGRNWGNVARWPAKLCKKAIAYKRQKVSAFRERQKNRRQERCNHPNLGKATGKLCCTDCGYQEECSHLGLRRTDIGNVVCIRCGAWIENAKEDTCDMCGEKGIVKESSREEPEQMCISPNDVGAYNVNGQYWWTRESTMPRILPLICLDTDKCEERVRIEYSGLPWTENEAAHFRNVVTRRQVERIQRKKEWILEASDMQLNTLRGHGNRGR